MHKQVIQWCESVKKQYPSFFVYSNILDVGSIDINGNNRYLFGDRCRYFGIDIIAGKNVDIVCPIKDFTVDKITGVKIQNFDIVICTEMLEHDKDWFESLKRMYQLLRDGGMLLLTCATVGRKKHGVYYCQPEDSPATLDWYKPIGYKEFSTVLPMKNNFLVYNHEEDTKHGDFKFWGIK